MNVIMHNWISVHYYILVIAGIVSTVARKRKQSLHFNSVVAILCLIFANA